MPGAGRPEQPLAPSVGRWLAVELRWLRRRKGFTYRRMAAETGLAVSTLRGAASGEKVPSWRVVEAFVTCCGGDVHRVRALWENVCAAVGKSLADEDRMVDASAPELPNPVMAKTPEQFVILMRQLRAWAGSPSLKTLNERSGGFLLPPATVSEALRRSRLPRRQELLSAYVRACGLDEEQARVWEQAWVSLKSKKTPELAGPVVRESPVALATDPDKELLSRHAAGDPNAFAFLVGRHRDRMWAVALRTLGDAEEAADALQDAFLAAYRAAGRFRGDASVATWLHRIVVNACIDRLRRRLVRPVIPMGDNATLDSIASTKTDPTRAHEVSADVSEALRRIPWEQRAALVLVDMMGYTIEDAAKVLEVPPGTIKSRCARGRDRLAPLLRHLRAGVTDGGIEHKEVTYGSARDRPLAGR